MRVLDTVTGVFCLINPRPKDRDSKPFKYAILSHTWDRKGEEQSYKQLKVIQKESRRSSDDVTDVDDEEQFVEDPLDDPTGNESPGPILIYPTISPKIQEACRVARQNGYRYLWIDFCCIDKTSSSEVSESISSMYEWYALADVCYAFLADVPPTSAEQEHNTKDSRFRRSRWFTRGWTLPELIAPFNVVFLAQDWSTIGSKLRLGKVIAEITKIDPDALLHIEPLNKFSVAERFSWASERKTTKVEDRAYSLLGIFGVTLPTQYGEGEHAFRRLQEEIIRHIPDQSLLAWTAYELPSSSSQLLPYNPHTSDTTHYTRTGLVLNYDDSSVGSSLLATSPDAFKNCGGIKALTHNDMLSRLHIKVSDRDMLPGHYDFTSHGIRVPLFMMSFETSKDLAAALPTTAAGSPPLPQWYLVILGCELRGFPGYFLTRVCCFISSSESSIRLLHPGYIRYDRGPQFDLLPMLPKPGSFAPNKVYIPLPRPAGRDTGVHTRTLDKPHQQLYLILPKKNEDALFAQGYMVTVVPDGPSGHVATLTHAKEPEHVTKILYNHNLNSDGGGSLSMKTEVTTLEGNRTVNTIALPTWADFGPRWQGRLGPAVVPFTVHGGWTLSHSLALFTRDYYLLSIVLEEPNQSWVGV